MHYAIHCLDHDGAVQRRLDLYDQHKAYLAAASIRTLISGPLLAEDEATMIGSLFVVEADSIEAVRRFNAEDPFARAGLWKQVDIHPFNKRVDNR